MKTQIAMAVVSVGVLSGCGEGSSSVSPQPPRTAARRPPPSLKPAPSPEEEKVRAPQTAPAADAALKLALLGPAPSSPAREPSPRAARRRIRQRQRREKEQAGDEAFAEFAAGALVPPELSDSDFQNTIGQWKGLSRCLAQGTRRMHDRSGALELAFSIKPDGSVAKCDVIRAGSRAAQAIAACVARKARRMRFPSFSGSEVTERTAKFVF